MKLKYGMNPYQKDASLVANDHLQLLNGSPSFINVLDALNSWQLVNEVRDFDESIAAASFKHVTPSGVAIAKDLSELEKKAYFVRDSFEISPVASAYIRARGTDRLASFGDFIAVNARVDLSASKVIRSEVSDGIIAPGFEADAFEILRKKKSGSFLIFEIDPDYVPPRQETRDVFGFRLVQNRNDFVINETNVPLRIVTRNVNLPKSVVTDLYIGMITLKYTQSNSICVIKDGQVVGVGSGQQSRILCTELTLSKAKRWAQKLIIDYSRIEFPDGSTRADKDQIVEEARQTQYSCKNERLENVSMCSDGYFPRTDNIELAANEGVRYIAAPMGSMRDDEIIDKCDEKGIVFCDTRLRLFHH